MSLRVLLNKMRQIDYVCSNWMMRHFYIIFFEIMLIIIAALFFYTNITSVVLPAQLNVKDNLEHLLIQQGTNTRFLVILMLFNSFLMLFLFNGMNRLRLTLKDLNFNLTRRRYQKNADSPTKQQGS